MVTVKIVGLGFLFKHQQPVSMEVTNQNMFSIFRQFLYHRLSIHQFMYVTTEKKHR